MTRLYAALIAFLVVVFPTQFHGASISPSAEGEVEQTGLGTIIGPFVSGYPFVSAGTINGRFQSGAPSLPNAVQAVFEFNVSALDGSTINNAVFSFTLVNPVTEGVSSCFDLVGCPPVSGLGFSISPGDGTVSPSNWNAGALLGSISNPAFGVTLTFDVTTALNHLLASDAPFVTMDVSALAGQDGLDGVEFQPSLIVNQTPEPASYAFTLIALLSLMIVHQRQRKLSRDLIHR